MRSVVRQVVYWLLVLGGLAWLDEYDLLHGDESYKFQWAPKSRALVRLEAFPGSTRGRFGRHAIGAGKALRRRARRLLGNNVADRLIAAMRSTG